MENKFLLKPSVQYNIASESIPNNGVHSVRYQGDLLAFFRHDTTQDNYSTQISVVSLATERTIFILNYQWKVSFICSRTIPPLWIRSPTQQVCDLAISSNLLTFVTTENVLIYANLSTSTLSDKVACLSFSNIVQDHYAIHKVQRVCLINWESFACIVVQGKAMGLKVTIILLIDMSTKFNPQVHHYRLKDSLDIACFSSSNLLSLISLDTFALVLHYQDSLHQTQMVAIHLCLQDINQPPQIYPLKPHSKKYIPLLTHTSLVDQEAVLTCECPTTLLDGLLDTLNNLAHLCSTPFLSLVASDASNINSLSSRLNSPWSMPVALMQLILFLLLLPFLFLPKLVTQITITGTPKSLRCKRTKRFIKRTLKNGPFANYQQIIWAGNKHYGVVQDNSHSIILQKFTPTPLSQSAYSQPDAFRILSIFCYFFCLIVFSVSLLLIFTTVKSAKVDLIVEFAITDAAAVYFLAFCQDLLLGYSLLVYKWRQYFRSSPTKNISEPDVSYLAQGNYPRFPPLAVV